MTTQVKINGAEEAQTLMAETKAYQEAERAERANTQHAPIVKIPVNHSIAIRDEQATTRSSGATRVTTEAKLPDGHVKLSNGMVADRESVKMAGLESMIVGDHHPSFNQGSPASAPANAAPEMDAEGQDTNPENETETDTAKLSGVSEADAQELTKTIEALNQAREAIGTGAVDSMSADVVASGELPSADALPDGITPEMVATIARGYEVQANHILKAVPGATVNALRAFLTESELQDARRAAFTGNDKRLKEWGYKAVTRLQSLPDDPVLFAELTANWPKDVKVVRRNNVPVVITPKWEMPWADAVAAGKIKF